jgi:hypothetical protein
MDFNVDHYSLRELNQILDLPDRTFYEKTELQNALLKTMECNKSSDNISENEREKVNNFLVETYKKLTSAYNLGYDKQELQDIQAYYDAYQPLEREELDNQTFSENKKALIVPKKEKASKDKSAKFKMSTKPVLQTKLYVFNSKFRKRSNTNDLIVTNNDTTDPNYKTLSETQTLNSSTNFELKLHTPITDIVEMSFKTIEFLNSMYTVSANNNKMFIQLSDVSSVLFTPEFNEYLTTHYPGQGDAGSSDGSSMPWFLVEITPGNYFIDNIFNKTTIQNNINNQIAEQIRRLKEKQISYNGSTFNILNTTYNSYNSLEEFKNIFKFVYDREVTQNKSKITRVDPTSQQDPPSLSTLPFKMLFTNDVNPQKIHTTDENTITLYYPRNDPLKNPVFKTLGYTMGYRRALYTKDTNTLISTNNGVVYESESQFESQGTRNIYFEVRDDANSTSQLNHMELMLPDGTFRTENILAKVSVYSGSNTIQYEVDSDGIYRTRKYSSPVKINTLHIRLFDDNGEIIDNNNSDFSFTLEFKISPSRYLEE